MSISKKESQVTMTAEQIAQAHEFYEAAMKYRECFIDAHGKPGNGIVFLENHVTGVILLIATEDAGDILKRAFEVGNHEAD